MTEKYKGVLMLIFFNLIPYVGVDKFDQNALNILIFDLYYGIGINAIELHWRATRFVAGDHSPRSNITAVLAQ